MVKPTERPPDDLWTEVKRAGVRLKDPVNQPLLKRVMRRVQVWVEHWWGKYAVGGISPEDIVQEGVLKILDCIEDKTIDSPAAYFRTMIRNQCFRAWNSLPPEYYRNRENDDAPRERGRTGSGEAHPKSLAAPVVQSVDPEASGTLIAGIAALPDKQAVVIQLRLLGLAHVEIASRLNCRLGTIHWRAAAAAKRLRPVLHGRGCECLNDCYDRAA